MKKLVTLLATSLIPFTLPASATTSCQYPSFATYTRNYSEAAWKAALNEYWTCRNREDKEQARKDEAAREKARGATASLKKAANELIDRASERATQGAIEAHGDVALGVGGPRDAGVDKVGNAAVKAAGYVPQVNGISAKLSDMAIRSAVDVNSRAIGTFNAKMNEFGGVGAPTPSSRPLPAPGFAHIPSPSPAPDLTSFSSALGTAARDAGARGASDMQTTEGQLRQAGVSERVGSSVRAYNASIESSSSAISAQRSADAQFLNRYHEIRDEVRANAAARSSSSRSASSRTNCGSEKYGCGVNGRGQLVDAKGNVYGNTSDSRDTYSTSTTSSSSHSPTQYPSILDTSSSSGSSSTASTVNKNNNSRGDGCTITASGRRYCELGYSR